jgi:hypothetical protein
MDLFSSLNRTIVMRRRGIKQEPANVDISEGPFTPITRHVTIHNLVLDIVTRGLDSGRRCWFVEVSQEATGQTSNPSYILKRPKLLQNRVKLPPCSNRRRQLRHHYIPLPHLASFPPPALAATNHPPPP